MKPRNAVAVNVDPSDLVAYICSRTNPPIPRDAVFARAYHDQKTNALVFEFEHPSFPNNIWGELLRVEFLTEIRL